MKRGYTAIELIMVVISIFAMFLFAGVLYSAFHFISKFW